MIRSIASDESPLPLPSLEKFKGCLFGCAVGDVVGAWAEKRPATEARNYAEYFVHAFDFSKVSTHHHGASFGQYTDDTQLTRELALSLVDEGGWSPEDFAGRIARLFAQDLVVGCGQATKQAAQRLLEGVPWGDAGTPPPSAGNGAAMRAAPMGLFFWDDVDCLVTATTEQAIITHKAPMSVAGAVAVAVATGMCLNASPETSGPHEPGWWSWLVRFVERTSPEFAKDIREMTTMVFKGRKSAKQFTFEEERQRLSEWVLEADDPSWSGASPWARTSVLWSLYCLLAHPRDPWAAIELAVWIGGDSDTIASMAGAMVGAHVGFGAFPEKVRDEVAATIHDKRSPEWDWSRLEKLAEQLHEVVERRHQGIDAEETPVLSMFGD